MSRAETKRKKQGHPAKEARLEEKHKEKFKSEPYLRSKVKEIPAYNTTPGDKYYCRHVCCDKEKKPEKKVSFRDRRKDSLVEEAFYSAQFEYIRNNLCIKFCIGNRDLFRFQRKKVSIRNYTPKSLNQEVNLGMWI
ncbi:unnamed protein product [Acanthoscelides obtectus]|uniref:Uncharacterized protein n=1 Tax=Acanthoscelides obtectus TaxID=200917 RepID=A0A9P0M8P7_ACAOB|nr:unnamed protein product [Acanthoscelides obtectus]CAK1659687.1 hypothetical protein AOBTE_LOCUS21623 [Acanthoscelides obtectus]